MRKFTTVSPKLWTSRRFRALSSDDARLLYLFLMTGPYQNIAGVFPLMDAIPQELLGWDAARYTKARQKLVEGEMICFDEVTGEIMVRRWFQNTIEKAPSPKTYIGAQRTLAEDVESETLREAALAELEDAWANAAKANANKAAIRAKAESFATGRPMSLTELKGGPLKGGKRESRA